MNYKTIIEKRGQKMKKPNVFETYLSDVFSSELCKIEALFKSMQHLENINSALIYDLGSIGKTLVAEVRDDLDSLCNAIAEIIGEIEVIREDHHDDNLKHIEGFKIEFSNIIARLASMDKFPPHVEVIKNYEMPGRSGFNYLVSNVKEKGSLSALAEDKEPKSGS